MIVAVCSYFFLSAAALGAAYFFVNHNRKD